MYNRPFVLNCLCYIAEQVGGVEARLIGMKHLMLSSPTKYLLHLFLLPGVALKFPACVVPKNVKFNKKLIDLLSSKTYNNRLPY